MAGQAPNPAVSGDLPTIPRPQQAVDPAVMQFYMQQPQATNTTMPQTTAAGAMQSFFPAQSQSNVLPTPKQE